MTPATTSQRVRPSSSARTSEPQRGGRSTAPTSASGLSWRETATVIGVSASTSPVDEPGGPAEAPAHKVIGQRDRADAHQRLGHEHARRAEAERPGRQRLDPQRQRRLVHRHDAGGVKRVVEEVVPAARHRPHGGRVVGVGPAVAVQRPEVEHGDDHEQREQLRRRQRRRAHGGARGAQGSVDIASRIGAALSASRRPCGPLWGRALSRLSGPPSPLPRPPPTSGMSASALAFLPDASPRPRPRPDRRRRPGLQRAGRARAQHPPAASLPGREFPFTWRIVVADNASTDATPADRGARSPASCPASTHLRLDRKGRGLALREAWSAAARVVAYMDVDLSTDLRGCCRSSRRCCPGHSDVAIGSRLARGARVVRGPKRELISRAYNRILHRPCASASPTPSAASRPSAATARRTARRCPRRRLVLRHRAARARPAARPAHPRGAGRLGRRPRLARATSCARRSTTSRASRGCSPPRRSRASWPSAWSARSPTPALPALARTARRGRGQRRGARAHRGGEHGGQPPAHLRRARPQRLLRHHAQARSSSCSRSR